MIVIDGHINLLPQSRLIQNKISLKCLIDDTDQ